MLSSDFGTLRESYDIIIVGSGYGGSVAAARLGGGRKVALLERGREFQPGEFPETLLGAASRIRVDTPGRPFGKWSDLYDFRINDDVNVVIGCGIGGTSLINAGVLYRPTPDVFDSAWPSALQREAATPGSRLNSAFELASATLDPARYPGPLGRQPSGPGPVAAGSGQRDEWPALKKVAALRELALAGSQPEFPPVCVTYRPAPTAGGLRRPCILCGDCVSGCNHGAKNTVTVNYLPQAVALGVELHSGVEVRWLERNVRDDVDGWLVHCRVHSVAWVGPPPEIAVWAETVVLAAGTLGTTEILLRSRTRGLSLSPRVGQRFSSNGDMVALAANGNHAVEGIGRGLSALPDNPVGATIVGALDERRLGWMIQEGVIPRPLRPLTRWFLPIVTALTGTRPPGSIVTRLRHLGRWLHSILLGSSYGGARNTLTLLVMGHESAGHDSAKIPDAGGLELRNDRIRVQWPGAAWAPYFRTVRWRLRGPVHRAGAAFVANPFRLLGRRAKVTTVHPLGGCGMADRGADGVVDAEGRVFRGAEGATYQNLLAMDGSIVPKSLGVNPILTITALAERIAAGVLDRRCWAPAYPGPAPLPPAPSIGVTVAEVIRGELHRDGGRHVIELRLSMSARSLDQYLQDDRLPGTAPTPAVVLGQARCASLSPRPLTVTGKFHLFRSDQVRVETRLMRYELELTDVAGKRYALEGSKVIHDEPGRWDIWRDLSRFEFQLKSGRDVVGDGELRLSWQDLWRMARAVRFPNARGVVATSKAWARFLGFYARMTVRTLGFPFAPADRLNPVRSRQPAPALYTAHPFKTDDGETLELLRRNAGGSGPPVILAPGFGTSTLAFRLNSIVNIGDYLAGAGYDVWLLDWRGSERSSASKRQFSVDHVAEFDWPAAVEKVRQVTDASQVDIIGHCVGSMSLLMSLLKGYLPASNVRSVICSASFPFIDMPLLNQIKAYLRLGTLLHLFWRTLDPDTTDRSPWHARLLDQLLTWYPTKERCTNPICHRNLLLYGEVYRHDNLNPATHDLMFEMFDRANLTTFRHLLLMIRHGRVVDALGADSYLTGQNGQLLSLPITILQGEKNNLFRPTGAVRFERWLRANQHPDGSRRLVMLPNYGHMDVFIGRDAHRDTFPIIASLLKNPP